ncbi:MAG: hypothetical protein KAJ10_12310 [Thermodesulfovibrionia bacterium]|nr:hypothetical protein [Thermodesulfovibrionia bacterium]
MAEEELYFNKAEGLEYAKRQGYPFGKSKFYADLKYVPRVNNKFSKKEIDKHIKDKIINSAGLAASDEAGEKLRQDTRTAKARADKLEFELGVSQGLYIPISDLEKELAHRGALLKTGIDNFFTTQGSTMIDICEGSQENEGAFVNYCLESVEDHFDQYSKNIEFDVPAVNLNDEESEG